MGSDLTPLVCSARETGTCGVSATAMLKGDLYVSSPVCLGAARWPSYANKEWRYV